MSSTVPDKGAPELYFLVPECRGLIVSSFWEVSVSTRS